jgi:protein TonB
MKRKLLLSISTCLLFLFTNAQDDENKIFTKVNIESGTDSKQWAAHVKKYTHLPDSVLRGIPDGTYKVTVRFVIDIHGNIGQIKAKNDPGYGFATRAENIVTSYKGKWIPANQCGRNVKSYKEETIVFIIATDVSSQPNL